MSKKRTSTESNADDQTNEVSNPIQTDAKRAKLVPLSDTTLQDLPNELLADILSKAVVMEVKEMRLAKSVWKEKADLVMTRLRTVCSPWNSILETNFLRNKVHGILDGTAKEKFRLEILHQSQIQPFVEIVVTLKDDIFMLCRPENQEPFINVHNRNNLEEVKDVIPLPGMIPVDFVACSVSNCLFVLDKGSQCRSVLRIMKDEENQFQTSPWISNPNLPFYGLFAGFNGRLIILSREAKQNKSVVSIYDVNCTMQLALTLFPAIHGITCITNVIQKANGNLILADRNDQLYIDLKEIDAMGRVLREYRSSILGFAMNVADACGRIMISGLFNGAELLDSEFNLLDFNYPLQDVRLVPIRLGSHYDIDRNEIVCGCFTTRTDGYKVLLAIFRVTEQ